MKLLVYYFLIILTLNSCNKKNNHFAIVVHGGAGTILKDNMTNEMEKAYKQKLEEALNVGYSILKQNGKSVDAVEATIKILEDSELFNAGKGSVLYEDKKSKYFLQCTSQTYTPLPFFKTTGKGL